MLALHQPEPEVLAEAFRIESGMLPLKPERAHLTALKNHFRDWTSTIMEEATPRTQKQTIQCQHEGCKSGWITDDEGEKSECPVCDGNPEIDYDTVATYALQIDQLRAHTRELMRQLGVARNEIQQRDLLQAQADRLSKLPSDGKKPTRKETGTVVVMQGVS